MSIYIVQDRQTLFDIALLIYGRAEAVFDMAMRNNIQIDETLEPGAKIELIEIERNDKVVRQYSSDKVCPATALEEGLLPGGIGYMAIESDFIIS